MLQSKAAKPPFDNAHRCSRTGAAATARAGLTLEQIAEQLALAVDRVMGEGSLYDRNSPRLRSSRRAAT
jgi:alpha-D-ribose 1-methylphosphonate 5-triphosphate synthase subunit PhnI